MLKLSKEKDELRVVNDEVLTPTFTEEIAGQTVKLVQNQAENGLYHATAEGSCSWYEFAREIFSLAGINIKLNVAGSDEFPAKVPRPKYSVLENAALKKMGLNIMNPWPTGLKNYLSKKLI